MIKSTSAPVAIAFSYEEEGSEISLGHWIIDYDNPVAVVNEAWANKKYIISMDIGATSTNVYMREVIKDNPFGNLKSISSAGKFLLDIYNPYVTEQNKGQKNKSDFIQNYYLFSGRCGEMGKILTYGQSFQVTKNGVWVYGPIPNVTGRALFVDNDYFLSETVKDNGIFSGLRCLNPITSLVKEVYIQNLLTYAVLEARANDARDIEVRFSYPDETFAARMQNIVNQATEELSCISGIRISAKGTTSARAIGEYYVQTSIGRYDAPNPTEGFAVVDIGRDYSGFSYMKKDVFDTQVDEKANLSLGFAGKALVLKTFIQFFDCKLFECLWEGYPFELLNRLASKYCSIAPNQPTATIKGDDYREKEAILEFLLEKCEINYHMLARPENEQFLSAMRIKYYALFYVIAHYIKKNLVENGGQIKLSDYNLCFCLAGCGAKGIKICSETELSFLKNVESIFLSILKANEAYGLELIYPYHENKAEIAIGLALAKNDLIYKVSTVVHDDGWDIIAGVPFVETTKNMPFSEDELTESYFDALNMCQLFEKADEDHFINKIDPRKNASAKKYFNIVFGDVVAEVRNSSCATEVYDRYFALLMLEHMIDHFCAEQEQID